MLDTLDRLVMLPLLPSFDELAERGAEHLDQHGPTDWPWLTDPDRLDLQSTADCVAGQVYGDFWELPALAEVRPASDPGDEARYRLDIDKVASRLGFAVWPEHAEPLRAAWIRAINRRRAAAQPAVTDANLANAA
ncbi:hypothetical protein I0C86_41640 [Plantactinospora sp. S1510]|uniref:Uncharacterized protein n=1 Tax=Plantactinospora alkalitolerans TaxID=2789879 RepID=A0ABS0HB65_9ACTN|nr:hypothetical protein [Plantactinospora alkalitolerans]MBF9135357.1 hypothetical protein [Plantactinospora alkalitolerans]